MKNPASPTPFSDTLSSWIGRGLLAGTVTLVANRDGVLDVRAAGYADLAARQPLERDALFWIASVSKPIAATALMMLVDEGKVRLDDPVEAYLPEFTGQQVADAPGALRKPAHPIRVREILSHASGLPFALESEKPTFDLHPLHEAVRAYAAAPLLFEPGSRYLYSNAGINTAGRIIEVVAGQPYETFLEERLFAPLGMPDTTFTPSRAQISRLAKTYRPAPQGGLEEVPIGQVRYPLDAPGRYPFPGGGLFSTAADLGRFGRMILNRGELEGRRYLSEAAVAEMTTPQTAPSLPTAYGLGWSIGEGRCGHGGAYKNDLSVNWRHGFTAILLLHHAADWQNEETKTLLPTFHAEATRLATGKAADAPSDSFPSVGSQYR